MQLNFTVDPILKLENIQHENMITNSKLSLQQIMTRIYDIDNKIIKFILKSFTQFNIKIAEIAENLFFKRL